MLYLKRSLALRGPASSDSPPTRVSSHVSIRVNTFTPAFDFTAFVPAGPGESQFVIRIAAEDVPAMLASVARLPGGNVMLAQAAANATADAARLARGVARELNEAAEAFLAATGDVEDDCEGDDLEQNARNAAEQLREVFGSDDNHDDRTRLQVV